MSFRGRGFAAWVMGVALALWPVVSGAAERPLDEASRALAAMAAGETDEPALRRVLAQLQKRDADQQRQFAAVAGKRLPPAAAERFQAARTAYAAGQGRLLTIASVLVRDLGQTKARPLDAVASASAVPSSNGPALLAEAQELVRRLEEASRRAPISSGELKVKAPMLSAPALATAAPPSVPALPEGDTPIGPVPLILKQAAAALAGPVDVYEWVRNTIRPEFYHGAMKGAERTYAEGSGNDADTAALLIQLLRAKGIPARFARGTVQMPGPVLQSMAGTSTVEQAVRVLERAAIPHEVVTGAGGIASVRVERVWAEAYVPYANYRGAVMDQHGKAWIPLDAGFKRLSPPRPLDPQRDLGLDVHALVDDYLAHPQTATPREVIRSRVTERLALQQPPVAYEQFLNRRDALSENLGLLPSTLPFRPTGAPEVGYDLPDVRRHTVHFKAESGERTILDATVPVADLLGRRLTLSYVPFAPEDEDLARQFGGLLKTPPYLVQVKAVLKSGGVDLVGGSGPVGLGVKLTLTLEFRTPGGTQTVSNELVAGNLTAIGLGGHGVARQEEPGGKAAQILSALAQAYLESWDKSDDELAGIFKVVPVRPTVSACFVLSEIDVEYAGGDPLYPVRYEWKGIAVDADLRASAPVGIVDRASERAFTLASALEGSVLEHRVFEDTLGISSVSTAKALALAAAAGITVHDLTAANVEAVLPALPLAESVKSEVRDAIARGFLARVPAAPVSYLAWRGVGYVLFDEETGEAAYQLQGGHSGGVTAPSVIEIPDEVVDPLLEGDEEVEPAPEDSAVARVEKFISVDFQEGTVDQPVKSPLKVLVTDVDGYPIPRAFVTFSVIGGAGRLVDPEIPGDGASEVVVRANGRGEAAAILVLGKKTDAIPQFVDLGGEFKEQVGVNLVAVRSGAATLPEPFIAIAYPDYRRQADGTILANLKWKGQKTSCFACGWPNLRVAALMALQVSDQHDNPISNAEVTFAYRPDPVPSEAPPGLIRMRPGNRSPGRVLKVADYLACLERSANPLWGECDGEAASVVARSSSDGAYAYAALGDSPFSYYYFDILTDFGVDGAFVAYPTSGWMCNGPAESCGGSAPGAPIVSMGQRVRITNRLGNAIEAYLPDTPATFDLWVDELSEDDEVFTNANGDLNVRGLNTWRRERLLDSVFTLQATTPGTLTSPSARHTGNGTYRAEMTMGGDPQLNTVRYTGVHIPWVIPYTSSGLVDPASVFTDGSVMRVRRVKDPQRAITTSDDFSLWGVLPQVARVVPAPILVDASGTVTRPSRVEYTIAPEDYRKLLAPIDVVLDIRKGDTSILMATAQVGTGGDLDPTFDIPRGLFMAAGDNTASVNLVGVSAAAAGVKSQPFPLRTCPLVELDTPTVVMSYTRDPVNKVTCGKQEEVVFTLCRDARVTLTVAESVVTGGVDNGTTPVAVTDLLLAAGVHRVTLPPGIVTGDDILPFAVRAVDAVDPTVELTEPGTLVAAFRNRSVLPVGHTFVKGVDLYDGHVVRQGTDIKIAGRHLGLEMTRTYSSVGRGPKGLIGAGWAWNWEASLSPSGSCGLVSVSTPDGSSQVFRTTDGGRSFKPQKGYHTTLLRAEDGSYDFIDKSGTRYHFRAPVDPAKPDEDRRLEYIEEPHLDRLVPTYDNQGRITRIAEVHPGAGEVRTLEIDYQKKAKFDRIVRAFVPGLGIEATYSYDTYGNLASTSVVGDPVVPGSGQGASRSEQFEYSTTEQRDRHQMLSTLDPNGSRTQYEYYRKTDRFPGEENGALAVDLKEEFVRRVREFARQGPVPEPLTEFQYDYTEALSSRFKTTVKDPRGNETLYVMNGNGSPLEIREPLGRTTRMDWATDDIYKVRETDPLLRVTTYGYDARGNLTRESIAAGDLGPVDTVYEYDGRFNKLTLKTDAEGRTTRYEIDSGTGDLLGMTDAVGNATQYRYDTNGRLTEVIDPRGHSTAHRNHDSFGNAREIVDPLGNRTDREYDGRGRLVSETDTLGREMATTHDGLDRPTEVRRVAGGDSDDAVTTTSYYPGGQVNSTTNAGGASTTYSLDDLNRVVGVQTSVDGQSFGTQLTLDGNGNAIKEIDRRNVERGMTYDALNRATQTAILKGAAGEGPLGVVAKYTYDLAGNKLSETSVAGLTTNYVYDGLYRVAEKHLPEGNPRYVERFAYDKVGNRTSVKDANGNETKYAYDGLNRVIRTENALGHVTTVTFRDPEGSKVNKGEDHDLVRGLRTTYSYDVLNRETKRVVALEGAGSSGEAYETSTAYEDATHSLTVRDPRGTVTSVRLDGLDHAVEQVVDPGGLALMTRTSYDGLGNRKRVVDPEQHATGYGFDGLGRLRQVTDAGGQQTSYDYDGDGLKTQETDRRGVSRTFTYDNLGRPRTTVLSPSISGVPWRHEIRYEDAARKRREIDVRLKETVSELDGLDRAAKVTDPYGFSASLRYDGVHKRAETNKRGHTTTFDFDAVNRLTRVTDPAPFGYTTETTYDDAANRRSEKDRRETARVVQLDSLGRVRSTTRAGVLQEANEYDANSNRTLSRDGESKQTRFTYDRGNRMTVRVDGDGSPAVATTTFLYDKDGLVTEERDARAATLGEPFSVRNTYDAVHRLETVNDGESNTTRYAYDGEGSRTLVQEPSGAATSFVYEEMGKLLSVTQPGGRTTSHAYDGARNRIRQTDASNHVVEYVYDDVNRLTRMTQDPGGLALVTDYRYDENGNPREIVDPKRQTTTSVFDELDRLKSKSYAFASGDPVRPWRYTTSVAYEYDPNGNVLETRDSVASGTDPPSSLTTARVYDDLDRLTSETSSLPDGGTPTVGYSYFRNGVRESVTDPQGVATAYAYDGQNRLETVTTPGGISRYSYFGDDLLERIAYPNGVTATSGYDRADRLTSLVNAHGANVVSSYAYGYDANGNRLSQVETNGGPAETTTYTYDSLSRLETIQYPVDSAFPAGRDVAYVYDDVGNRTRETERTGAGDLLAEKQGFFDNANRLTELRDLVAPAGTTVFGWDRNGNQVSKTVGGVTTVFEYDLRDRMVETRQGTSILARMQYDGEGRRTKKIGSDGVVQYVYDQTSVLSEYNATGNVTATYEYGSDRLLSLVRPDEGRRWYSLDALRSVVNLTDDSGALVASYHLDAWGNFRFPTELTASRNRFAFTGYEWDAELGLFNAKARYFDPQIGRFTSQDSFLGEIDDPPSLHRYFYGHANPLRFIDPTGHGALDYVNDAGQSLFGFGKGVVKGTGNLVVGAVVGTGKLAITSLKLQYGTPEMKTQAAHELGEMGNAIIEGIKDQGQLLGQAASDPGQILDAAAAIGPERYGEVIGGAALDTALTVTMFTGVGAGAKVAQGAEAVVVGESRIAAATAGAEQAALRARVLANVAGSEAAKKASRFAAYADSPTVLAAEANSTANAGAAAAARVIAAEQATSSGGVICGSGGPCKVYEIPGEELTAGKPYIGKTRRSIPERMADKDHRLKTPSGKRPEGRPLAADLTPAEAAGMEALLAQERGLENLSNKIPPLNPNLPKNAAKIEAARKLLDKARGQ